MQFEIVNHGPRVYRVRAINAQNENGFPVSGADLLGQVRKVGREWQAEIRVVATGDLCQLAGIWETFRDATEECARIIKMEG